VDEPYHAGRLSHLPVLAAPLLSEQWNCQQRKRIAGITWSVGREWILPLLLSLAYLVPAITSARVTLMAANADPRYHVDKAFHVENQVFHVIPSVCAAVR
jgi:hypothetical protein